MKKYILLALTTVFLTSCGSDKKKENQDNASSVKDKYEVILDAVYEKDDSLIVYYQKDNYFQYEKPTFLKVKGSPTIQRLSVLLPEGVAIENLSITTSTNKEQQFLTIKNISVKNGTDIIDGDNYKHSEFFTTDASFSWDLKNSRYNLNHTNKYPPGMVGTENLKSRLMK